MRLWPSTSENSQMIRSTPGSSVKTVRMRKIHLRLVAGRGLEADLERRRLNRPDLAQQVGQDRVTTGVAEITQFAMQPTAGQLRKRCQALAQMGSNSVAALAGVGGDRTSAAPGLVRCSDALSYGRAPPARDGRYADTLAMQFKDHDDLPKPDQRRPLQVEKATSSLIGVEKGPRLRLTPSAPPGEFSTGTFGDYSAGTHSAGT